MSIPLGQAHDALVAQQTLNRAELITMKNSLGLKYLTILDNVSVPAGGSQNSANYTPSNFFCFYFSNYNGGSDVSCD